MGMWSVGTLLMIMLGTAVLLFIIVWQQETIRQLRNCSEILREQYDDLLRLAGYTEVEDWDEEST